MQEFKDFSKRILKFQYDSDGDENVPDNIYSIVIEKDDYELFQIKDSQLMRSSSKFELREFNEPERLKNYIKKLTMSFYSKQKQNTECNIYQSQQFKTIPKKIRENSIESFKFSEKSQQEKTNLNKYASRFSTSSTFKEYLQNSFDFKQNNLNLIQTDTQAQFSQSHQQIQDNFSIQSYETIAEDKKIGQNEQKLKFDQKRINYFGKMDENQKIILSNILKQHKKHQKTINKNINQNLNFINLQNQLNQKSTNQEQVKQSTVYFNKITQDDENDKFSNREKEQNEVNTEYELINNELNKKNTIKEINNFRISANQKNLYFDNSNKSINQQLNNLSPKGIQDIYFNSNSINKKEENKSTLNLSINSNNSVKLTGNKNSRSLEKKILLKPRIKIQKQQILENENKINNAFTKDKQNYQYQFISDKIMQKNLNYFPYEQFLVKSEKQNLIQTFRQKDFQNKSQEKFNFQTHRVLKKK